MQGWFAELVSYAAAAAARGGPHPAAGSTAEAAGIALDSLSREREQIADLRGQLADAANPIVGLAGLYEMLKGAVPGTGALGGAAAAGLTTEAVADRLTRAAAVAVASRVLASGEDPGPEGPWDAAFSACFLGADGAPAELKQRIVDRARELLGIQRALDGHTSFADMTAIERQAYAYALWNSGAIECIGDGLAVSEQADAIYDLRALIDGGAAEGEIDAWEAGLPDEAARAAVHLVRERLASSPARAARWGLSFRPACSRARRGRRIRSAARCAHPGVPKISRPSEGRCSSGRCAWIWQFNWDSRMGRRSWV